MSLLPGNTYANPQTPFYEDGGGGADNQLQSPAEVIPDVNGNITLSMLTPDGNSQLTVRTQGVNDTASLFVRSDNGNAVLTIDASGGGGASLIMNGLDGQSFTIINQSSTTPSLLTMAAAPAQVGQSAFLTYDPSAGTLALGDSLPTGAVVTNQSLRVQSAPSNGNAVQIQSTGAAGGAITNSVATGGALVLGSSAAAPAVLTVSDAGVNAQSVTINDNPSNTNQGILMTPGTPGFGAPIIRSTAPTSGPLVLGSSATNPTTLYIQDGGAANTATVDITGGGANAFSLRLQGPNTLLGPLTAQVSTSLPTGGGGTLNFTNGYNDPVPNISMTVGNTTLNGLVLLPNDLSFQGTGSITAFQTFQTTGVVCGDNTTTGIPNPSGLVIGLYLVLARGTIGGVSATQCSVSTIAYYTTSGWIWGGGSACPALVSAPPSYIGIQGGSAALVLANGGGLGTVTMDFTYLKLGGNLGI
jgi:hypothetical protein